MPGVIRSLGSGSSSRDRPRPSAKRCDSRRYRFERPTTQGDGATVWGDPQSVEVRGATPGDVMGFYDDTLLSEGWEQLGEVDRSGTSTYRGDWTHGRWTRRVSANDANGLGDEELRRSQQGDRRRPFEKGDVLGQRDGRQRRAERDRDHQIERIQLRQRPLPADPQHRHHGDIREPANGHHTGHAVPRVEEHEGSLPGRAPPITC